MRITFKNVDQGDSIILEWVVEGTKKIGIIDCNNNRSKQNPVIQHLETAGYKNVEFIILSHPHTDHYSGMPELLDFLLENKIPLKFFIHTSTSVPDYLKMANPSREAANNIQELFKKLDGCREQLGTIAGTVTVGLNDELPLGDGYVLKFLAPTTQHIHNYTGRIEYDHDYEVEGNSHYANWLSTVLQLKKDNVYVLLTSDTPKDVLKEIGIRDNKQKTVFHDKTLLLGQCPHHGAKRNHTNSFWKLRNRIPSAPIVFSVGKNTYGHPSDEAVNFFSSNNYQVFSTNKVNGLDILSLKGTAKAAEAHADIFSIDITTHATFSDYYGDKVFEISGTAINVLHPR